MRGSAACKTHLRNPLSASEPSRLDAKLRVPKAHFIPVVCNIVLFRRRAFARKHSLCNSAVAILLVWFYELTWWTNARCLGLLHCTLPSISILVHILPQSPGNLLWLYSLLWTSSAIQGQQSPRPRAARPHFSLAAFSLCNHLPAGHSLNLPNDRMF